MMPIKAIYNMLPLSSSCYDFTAQASEQQHTLMLRYYLTIPPKLQKAKSERREEKCRFLSGLLKDLRPTQPRSAENETTFFTFT
eukprot:scaffold9398_cov135-Skeletonema_dohrnii-CCMP3373.AAC.9